MSGKILIKSQSETYVFYVLFKTFRGLIQSDLK